MSWKLFGQIVFLMVIAVLLLASFKALKYSIYSRRDMGAKSSMQHPQMRHQNFSSRHAG